MIHLGVIGYGYWGPQIVRNFVGVPGCEISAICDARPECLARARATFPGIKTTTDAAEVITSPTIDAVAVITPVWTHFELAKRVLENGKHVFVEKPFTAVASQAEELIELAEQRRLQIMVDHTFLFTGAVKKIRELLEGGTLGQLYYYDSTRVNLGLFQHDINVIWDLAPHDLSILGDLIPCRPDVVIATGQTHLNGFEDLAYITIYYVGKIIAHINVNWLSPVKVRTTLIGGDKRMLMWNDLDPDEKVRVYDRGVKMTGGQGIYDLLVSYRSGDMWAPKLEQTEALAAEACYFVRCVEANERPFNDGAAGLKVVRLLEAADRSLKDRGRPVQV